MVFENLGEERATEMYNALVAQGMSEDDAWVEVYSAECLLDEERK